MSDTLNNYSSNIDILRHIQKDKLRQNVPVIIFLTVSAIIGIVGNSLTIRFYATRVKMTSTAVFIQYIGIIDIIVCIILFTSIANLTVNVNFTSGILCKLLYFFQRWFISGSVFVLWIISIDRYLKVCRPFGQQFSEHRVLWVVLMIMLISSITSVSSFWTYDSTPIQLRVPKLSFFNAMTNNHIRHNTSLSTDGADEAHYFTPVYITGHYCTSTDEDSLQLFVKIFYGCDVALIIMTLLTFLFAYGNIIRVLVKNSNKTHTCNMLTHTTKQSNEKFNNLIQIIANRKPCANNESVEYTAQLSVNETLVELTDWSQLNAEGAHTAHFETADRSEREHIETIQTSVQKEIKSATNNFQTFDPNYHSKCNKGKSMDNIYTILNNGKESKANILTFDHRKSKSMVNIHTVDHNESKSRTRKSTEFNVTVMMAVVSFVLIACFIPYFIIAGIRTMTNSPEDELSVFNQLALRLPFINSVINPLIFCLFNPRYRRFIRNSCCRDQKGQRR